MSDIGHNSNNEHKQYVDRMVRMLEDLDEQKAEVRDLVKEASQKGISGRVLQTAAREAMDPARKAKRESFQNQLDQFTLAVGAI